MRHPQSLEFAASFQTHILAGRNVIVSRLATLVARKLYQLAPPELEAIRAWL